VQAAGRFSGREPPRNQRGSADRERLQTGDQGTLRGSELPFLTHIVPNRLKFVPSKARDYADAAEPGRLRDFDECCACLCLANSDWAICASIRASSRADRRRMNASASSTPAARQKASSASVRLRTAADQAVIRVRHRSQTISPHTLSRHVFASNTSPHRNSENPCTDASGPLQTAQAASVPKRKRRDY
jgi:hypothetical protein